MPLTYADTGVDRDLRKKAKMHWESLKSTYALSHYGNIIETPYNTLYPIQGKYQVKTCDGTGTKVLLAELAEKHDTIGIDAVAMVVNDCLRPGAKPIALTDIIDTKKSEPKLLEELQKGLNAGAFEAGCPLVGGETADVPELLNSLYHINCDCVGEVEKNKIITGKKVTPGDIVIGLRSSGVHSNGITLVRKALFKKWGGKYDSAYTPEELDKTILEEVLEPTRIYVNPILKVFENIDVHGAVHITGDAYLKFLKLGGFEFDNFHPQPIFKIIKEAGQITDDEMFKVFNMGWGFALIVSREDKNQVLDSIPKEYGAEQIGKVITDKKIVIKYKTKEIILGE
ncbi:phosphoribosylformylglycinamidine cyclo-ligase [archaeon]|nr:phosphoribosylformylglycinamidine cyclo-ligase [archaeon]